MNAEAAGNFIGKESTRQSEHLLPVWGWYAGGTFLAARSSRHHVRRSWRTAPWVPPKLQAATVVARRCPFVPEPGVQLRFILRPPATAWMKGASSSSAMMALSR